MKNHYCVRGYTTSTRSDSYYTRLLNEVWRSPQIQVQGLRTRNNINAGRRTSIATSAAARFGTLLDEDHTDPGQWSTSYGITVMQVALGQSTITSLDAADLHSVLEVILHYFTIVGEFKLFAEFYI